MALIQMNLMSQALMRTVPVNVIMPADKIPAAGAPVREEKPYKTLYLLHGVFGSYFDWVSGTRIQRYAEEKDLVVVMPSGDNAFYVDQAKAHNYYGEFVGKELVELTRKMFPLSRKREDTFIGGLSMGGFGSLRNGFKYHETFGNIVALSSALVLDEMPRRTNDVPIFIAGRDYAESCFGDLDKLLESDMNPDWLVKTLTEKGADLPKVYMACGADDGLLPANEKLAALLKEKNVDVTFEVGPGAHEWDFWDTYIKKGIDWLPTEANGMGINSGNVGN